MEWSQLEQLCALTTLSPEQFRAKFESSQDPRHAIAWARASVRDGNLMEALEAYDAAADLGDTSSAEERALVAKHVFA